MLVTVVEARPLRSLAQARIELGPGIVSLVGPNGVGKTNLLEALYFALTGRSFRTSDRRDLIPFGGSFARAEATIRDDDGIERHLLASVSRAEGRRHLLDGSAADPATLARSRPPVAVFSPDRLVAGQGPAGRAPRPPRRLRRRSLAQPGRAAPALWPGAGAAQRPGGRARRRPRRPEPARCLGRDACRRCRGADRGAGRGRGRARRPLCRRRRRAGSRGRGGGRVRATSGRFGGGDPRRSGRASRRRPAAGPDLVGAPPRRAQDRRRRALPAPLRLAGSAARRPPRPALRRARRPARGAPALRRCSCSTT